MGNIEVGSITMCKTNNNSVWINALEKQSIEVYDAHVCFWREFFFDFFQFVFYYFIIFKFYIFFKCLLFIYYYFVILFYCSFIFIFFNTFLFYFVLFLMVNYYSIFS